MYVRGVRFVNRRYKKGLLFSQKWYMKGQGVGPRGGASPFKTLLSTPSQPLLWKRKLLQCPSLRFRWPCQYLCSLCGWLLLKCSTIRQIQDLMEILGPHCIEKSDNDPSMFCHYPLYYKKILHYLLSRINKRNRDVLYWQFFLFVCPLTNIVTLLLSHHSMSVCKHGGKVKKVHSLSSSPGWKNGKPPWERGRRFLWLHRKTKKLKEA